MWNNFESIIVCSNVNYWPYSKTFSRKHLLKWHCMLPSGVVVETILSPKYFVFFFSSEVHVKPTGTSTKVPWQDFNWVLNSPQFLTFCRLLWLLPQTIQGNNCCPYTCFNQKMYFLFTLRIQSECGKIQTRKLSPVY